MTHIPATRRPPTAGPGMLDLGTTGNSSLTRRMKPTVRPDMRMLTAIRNDDSQMSSRVFMTSDLSAGIVPCPAAARSRRPTARAVFCRLAASPPRRLAADPPAADGGRLLLVAVAADQETRDEPAGRRDGQRYRERHRR